jgi:hypothetical protein
MGTANPEIRGERAEGGDVKDCTSAAANLRFASSQFNDVISMPRINPAAPVPYVFPYGANSVNFLIIIVSNF